MSFLLRSFVKNVLLQERRRDDLAKLSELAGDRNLFITFRNHLTLNTNVSTQYATPLGLYAYPLTVDIVRQLKNDELPFATEMKYVVLFECTSPQSLLKLQHINSIDDALDVFSRVATDIEIDDVRVDLEASGKNPAEGLWALLYSYANMRRGKYRFNKVTSTFFDKFSVSYDLTSGHGRSVTTLLKRAGYSGIVDYGDGIIHHNEPTQAVFFNVPDLKIVEAFDNPLIVGREFIKNDSVNVRSFETLISQLKNQSKGIIVRTFKTMNVIGLLSDPSKIYQINWKKISPAITQLLLNHPEVLDIDGTMDRLLLGFDIDRLPDLVKRKFMSFNVITDMLAQQGQLLSAQQALRLYDAAGNKKKELIVRYIDKLCYEPDEFDKMMSK